MIAIALLGICKNSDNFQYDLADYLKTLRSLQSLEHVEFFRLLKMFKGLFWTAGCWGGGGGVCGILVFGWDVGV